MRRKKLNIDGRGRVTSPNDKRLGRKPCAAFLVHAHKPGQGVPNSMAGVRTRQAQARKGKTLYSRIQEILESVRLDGRPGTRRERAAEAYVEQMENGSFIHLKEIIDREEGKTPSRIANADGTNVKAYVGIPIDDDPNAP